MVTKCPHCTHPLIYGKVIHESRGLVEHESEDTCKHCGTTFKYRLVIKDKKVFGIFNKNNSKYDRVEFWDIKIPESEALNTYNRSIHKKR